MADTAEEDQNQLAQDPADTGHQDEQQTPGDTAEARPTETGETPEEAGDDSDQTSDPLVLAQMEPETRADEKPERPAKTAAPKTTANTSTQQKPNATAPKPGSDDKAEAADDTSGDKPKAKTEEQDDPELAEALADLPQEDWSKVSHKTKSQFLAQRKLLRTQTAAVRAERKAREESEGRYQSVEKFVREHGLGDEEYVNAVAVSGAIKRNDPRVIPVLEATLQNLRRATGQPEQPAKPAPVQLDDDLAAILREAEEFGIDTSKVRSRFQAPAARHQEAPPAQPERQQPQQTQRLPQAQDNEVDAENGRILAYLQRRGIANPVARVAELIAANPDLASKPVGERYEAIIEAHSIGGVKQQPQQRRPVSAPMSGRGGPVRQAGATGPIDPLKHAIRR